MMSIGTLLSYTLVAASVLVLRYRTHDEALQAAAEAEAAGGAGAADVDCEPDAAAAAAGAGAGGASAAASQPLLAPAAAGAPPPPLLGGRVDARRGFGGVALCGFFVLPAWRAGDASVRMWRSDGWSAYGAAAAQLVLFCAFATLASVAVVVNASLALPATGAAACYAAAGAAAAAALVAAAAMVTLPQGSADLSFTTPLVPYLPLVSIAVNIYLLVSLSPFTWVRFAVWCLIGTFIYAFYGLRHSTATVFAPAGADKAAADASRAKVHVVNE
jgi:hypothetical protein